ncbi:8-oxoguanine DNA glycosylase [Halobacteriales archaeon QS_8_69_26]|nr:MAG: 8-oxoguanine DNA glycosylase [Halobacteriales archaeon QS_8_69_26]
MESGAIRIEELLGGFDLQSTVESGQSYLWRRADGRMYESEPAYGGSAWYHTVVDGEALRVRQVGGPREGTLEWESTGDGAALLTDLLRLDDDLAGIRRRSPEDDLVRRAYDAFEGMRLVRDPPFGTLVSFICSAQMRVARIHGMVTALAREYGDPVGFAGPGDDGAGTYYGFPAPERLAGATEAELRDLGLGYRAPYVVETARMVADGEDPAAAADLAYEDAREHLTRFVGVGDKVADCVLLFSLGFLEAVPLDTWIRTAIEDHYPGCERGTYRETSRAIREQFGGDVAGYVQTYVFNYLRTR